jgi:hypothetical protein
MKSLLSHAIGLAAIGFLPWVIGCESTQSQKVSTTPEARADDTAGKQVIGCQLCYDEAKSLTKSFSGGAQYYTRNQIVKQHQCPDCKADMMTYMKDGVPMFKCGHCAPEGVACDKCAPPEHKS